MEGAVQTALGVAIGATIALTIAGGFSLWIRRITEPDRFFHLTVSLGLLLIAAGFGALAALGWVGLRIGAIRLPNPLF